MINKKSSLIGTQSFSMKFCVITLLPPVLDALKYGITGKALEQQLITLSCINPREYANNKHQRIDDAPYGGGPGMLMQAPPLHGATLAAKKKHPRAKVICLSPQGRRFDQDSAKKIAENETEMILVAGRYEGIDQRYIDKHVDEEWSIGDYTISGGELAAAVVIDTISRLIPGVVGDQLSVTEDTFYQGLLKHPQYTRPEIFEGETVPTVLLSGNHEKIKQWNLKNNLGTTWLKRPDLLEKTTLSKQEQELLNAFIAEYKKEEIS